MTDEERTIIEINKEFLRIQEEIINLREKAFMFSEKRKIKSLNITDCFFDLITARQNIDKAHVRFKSAHKDMIIRLHKVDLDSVKDS